MSQNQLSLFWDFRGQLGFDHARTSRITSLRYFSVCVAGFVARVWHLILCIIGVVFTIILGTDGHGKPLWHSSGARAKVKAPSLPPRKRIHPTTQSGSLLSRGTIRWIVPSLFARDAIVSQTATEIEYAFIADRRCVAHRAATQRTVSRLDDVARRTRRRVADRVPLGALTRARVALDVRTAFRLGASRRPVGRTIHADQRQLDTRTLGRDRRSFDVAGACGECCHWCR